MERFDQAIPLPAAIAAGEFSSAQLIFYDVDHSGPSFEAPVFLDASGVDATTPLNSEAGFAGSFVIFGHGGCVGDEGHCDVPEKHKDPFDNRPLHALTPQTKTVDITAALKRVLGGGRSRSCRSAFSACCRARSSPGWATCSSSRRCAWSPSIDGQAVTRRCSASPPRAISTSSTISGGKRPWAATPGSASRRVASSAGSPISPP